VPSPAGDGVDPAGGAFGAPERMHVSDLIHESGVVGVIHGRGRQVLDANEAFLRMIGRRREEMVDGGAELLVGVAPSSLGQVLTLASGGVLAEVIDDAVFRLLPVGETDAREMVTELRGAAVLHGVRGRPALDVEALVGLLVDVSALVEGWPAGYELDLNPVVVLQDGVRLLDAAYVAPGLDG